MPPINGQAATDEAPAREYRVYPLDLANKGGKPKGERLPGRLLALAFVLVFVGFVGAGIVGYEAQRLFALAHNHTGEVVTEADRLRAFIIAALPDLGWVAMALVALVAALRGQSSFRARAGVLLFFALSLGAQVLYAPRTIEGILVAVIAPVAMAWMLESGLVELRRYVLGKRGIQDDEAPILTTAVRFVLGLLVALLRLLLWFVRLAFDPRSTFGHLRGWVLDTAPVAPGRSLASMRAEQAAAEAANANANAVQVQQVAAEEVREIEARAGREVEQVKAQMREALDRAAAETARVRAEAADEIEQAREDAARQVREVEQAAEARRRALIEQTAGDQSAQAERIADLERQADDLRRQLAQARARGDQADAAAHRATSAEQHARALREELDAARTQFDLLFTYAPGSAKVRAAAEAMRLTGDPRILDRDAHADLIRGWAQRFGLTERAVRRTLTEHIADPSAPADAEEV
ncbi:DUF2637 domain-containing protein [Microbispora sp. CA-102843]|uniref:DUF2637 domain-containing protein n=1 Tax=Microbispora sp. CA-102843 TaxID=3239952 RepID=UPI003D8B1E2B